MSGATVFSRAFNTFHKPRRLAPLPVGPQPSGRDPPAPVVASRISPSDRSGRSELARLHDASLLARGRLEPLGDPSCGKHVDKPAAGCDIPVGSLVRCAVKVQERLVE